jgi:hypothetical protein
MVLGQRTKLTLDSPAGRETHIRLNYISRFKWEDPMRKIVLLLSFSLTVALCGCVGCDDIGPSPMSAGSGPAVNAIPFVTYFLQHANCIIATS